MNNLAKSLLVLCFFGIFRAGIGVAQSRLIQQADFFELNEGLSNRLVKTIISGSDHLIWIGTQNGLNRFDGYEFMVFNSDQDNTHQISGSNIAWLGKDKSNRLVILYEKTLTNFDLFDPLTFGVQRVDVQPKTGVLGLVRTLTVDNDGEIYAAAFRQDRDILSIYRMNADRRFSLVFDVKDGFGRGHIDMIRLKNGDFLINDTSKGLILLAPDGQVRHFFTQLNHPCSEGYIKYPDNLRFLRQDRQGRVWIAWSGTPGVFRLSADHACFDRPQELPQDSYYIYAWEDEAGNLLFGQSSRLLSQDYPELTRFNCLTAENRVVDFSFLINPRNLAISAFSQDFFKTIFLGLDTGMKVIRNKSPNVKNFLDQDINTDERGASIRGITKGRDGKIYFAREVNYWYALDPTTNVLDTIVFQDEITGKPIEFNCSSNLFTIADTLIWGSSCLNGTIGQLHRYDIVNCTAKTFKIPYLISAFTVRRDGIFLLLCTLPNSLDGLLVEFNPATGAFKPVILPDDANPLYQCEPRYILESRAGDFWVATHQGVFVFDKNYRLTRHYESNAKDSGLNLSHNVCYVVYENETGQMLLGTENGLNIVDPESKSIRFYRKKDGIASDVVCGILPDEKGNYWISTYYGLSYLDTEGEDFQNFFVADGLSHNEFNRFAFFSDTADGRFYFGGVNGINAFYGNDFRAELAAPAPLLTKITRYDNAKDQVVTQDTGLLNLRRLLINPKDPYFILQFSLPEFYRSRHHKFWTRLDPVDKDWVYQGANNTVRYNRISAGKYTLRVAGALPNGLRSPNEYTLEIKIKQVFWLRWYIVPVWLCGILLLIYGGFKYRLEQRLEVERLRTKLASDLHDEVSGLLSGMAMQADVLQTMLQGEEKIDRVKTIAEASRKVMDKVNDVIWSIDSRKDRVEDLINRMQEHADEVLLPLNIRYDFRLEKINQQEKIPPFIRQNLYFIFKETVNNVAKHSSANFVTVSMANKANFFEMEIHDNGKLPPVNHLAQHRKKSGQGLNNLRMRAERLKAELNINPNGGYKVSLKMKKFG